MPKTLHCTHCPETQLLDPPGTMGYRWLAMRYGWADIAPHKAHMNTIIEPPFPEEEAVKSWTCPTCIQKMRGRPKDGR